MSAICGHCGAESPTVAHKCLTGVAIPTATFGVYTAPSKVELTVNREDRLPFHAMLAPELAAQLAAELVLTASRVAGKDMRAAFNRHLRTRRGE